ncbi:uncharacterized protein LOC142235418 [Haematobia irritans]|uniref:uncharacterized protein LOC142235418 n=1 Tax=Haematobia irritans TaxID=7368 RepID=UPI003F4F99DE
MLSVAERQCCTISRENVNIRQKINPWMTESLKSLIAYKRNLLSLRRKNKNNRDLHECLKRVSKVIKVCGRRLMDNFYERKINSFNGDRRKVWAFLNEQIGNKKCQTIDILDENNVLLTSDEDKASKLNNYFHKIIQNTRDSIPSFSNDDINMFNSLSPADTLFTLDCVSNDTFREALDDMKSNKAPGFDRITPKMLATRKDKVANMLTVIFNKMIRECYYPNGLKLHKIVPIPKETGNNKIENFRPVSVLPTVDKLIERVLFEQLSEYLEVNKLLFDRQYGFKRNTGTDEAVASVVECICRGLVAVIACINVGGVWRTLYPFESIIDLFVPLRGTKQIEAEMSQ